MGKAELKCNSWRDIISCHLVVMPVWRLTYLMVLVWTMSGCLESGRFEPPAPMIDTTEIAFRRHAPIDFDAGYNFDRPDQVYRLSSELREISGLTVFSDEFLGAVEDESAEMYLIRKSSGVISEKVDFGKNADYEGIEKVGEWVYVLRSDGTLFRFRPDGTKKVKSREWDTSLSRKNDTEGLAWDELENRLLVACKEDPGPGLDGKRAIYAFDLAREEVAEEPVFLIDSRDIERAVSRSNAEARLRAFLRKSLDRADFKPSALAVHPQSGHIWVLSSVFRVIVVLSREGTVQMAYRIDDSRLEQPEGLAIDTDGTVYLASEGGSGRAHLAVYRQR